MESNCGSHPLLRPGGPLPRQVQIRVPVQRLFCLATLKLQDPRVGRRTYAETHPLWQTLNCQYGVYLSFSSHDLMTIAESEDLTKVSEIVGIGCGLAALNSQFAININRFTRFTPAGGKRRADFQFYSKKRRYFHEAKGTTYQDSIPRLRGDIHDQKKATKKYCGKATSGPQVTASTGSITLYQHTSRTKFSSKIILLDPAGIKDETARLPRESDELSSVLRYYHNFYTVTHTNAQNVGLVSLDQWLAGIIEGLESGVAPPRRPPNRLVATGRTPEPGVPDSLYRGTIFDARIADRSVRTYPTFDDASAAIRNATTFIGVSEEVTLLIRSCQWDQLLEYSDRRSADAKDGEGNTILESGVMAKVIHEDESTETYSRRSFVQFRDKAQRQGRLLPRVAV